MELLKDRIKKEGMTAGGVLMVDSFLNHQIDVSLLNEIGKEFKRIFSDVSVDKILTIEASGIGVACIAAQYFSVPVLFAKKSASLNIGDDVYHTQVDSFTKGISYDIIVGKRFLNERENVLIIDDFLAQGNALLGLASLVSDAGANLVGCGICVEKAFQDGGKIIRDMGIRVESLVKISSMHGDEIIFAD